MRILSIALLFLSAFMVSCGEDDQPEVNTNPSNEVKVMIDGELLYLSKDNFFNQINRDKDNAGMEYFRLSFIVDHVSESAYNATVKVNLSTTDLFAELTSPSNGGGSYVRYSDENRPCTESFNYMDPDITTISITTDSDDLASGFIEYTIPFCFMYDQPTDVRVEFSGIDVDFD
ncbi:MAG: hypothetical protein ACWA44_02390 [Thiotrichales bacterium]